MHKINDLKIWHKAIDLTIQIYKATEHFPTEEKYGLTSQIRRSAVSIPSNISEGAGRNGDKEFNHFIGISNGSLFELQTQVVISNRLNLIKSEIANSLLKEIDDLQKMNYSFQKRLCSV